MTSPPAKESQTAVSPVDSPPPFREQDSREPEEGIGLCLSGGGYRAMLFHLGGLWRLNELGWLPRLKRISSVSGGSITAARLGLEWNRLQWRNGVAEDFVDRVAVPIRQLASRTIDVGSILAGAMLPGTSVGDRVARAYARHLYDDATLQDLPDDAAGAPRFVINATNVQTGAIWRFSKPYMADWRVGRVNEPELPLAVAVAASSAFPPVLSPVRLRLARGQVEPTPGADLHREPWTRRVVLTDGGVYDNLGLETVWKRYRTIIVSDGGGQMGEEGKSASDWIRHALRVNGLIDNQVRALRKRQIVGALVRGERQGAYWRMRGHIREYPVADALDCPHERTLELARTPTRLKAMHSTHQERLINWGYAICDAGIRAHVDSKLPAPSAFPYPTAAV